MSKPADHEPSLRTLTARAMGVAEPAYGGVIPAIYPSTAYVRDDQGNYPGGHSYTRDQNPTYDQAEALLAKLEGGSAALLFSSGMAAACTVFECLEPGDQVVLPRRMYWTIKLWAERICERRKAHVAFVDMTDLAHVRAVLSARKTRFLWVETPANPMGDITDLAAVSALAKAAGAWVVADNTTATPVLTRPLEFGVDVVMHSATKQLNGHSDVLAGALICKDEAHPLWELAKAERAYRGAVLGPFEAWLLLRGMRTLFLRVPAACEGALAVARYLVNQPQVAEVFYPGLENAPGRALAQSQMSGGFGSLVSFTLKGGATAAKQVASGLALFHNATSLGTVESLVEHRAPIEGAGTPVPDNLLRLSIGLEDPQDLCADLRQALEALQ